MLYHGLKRSCLNCFVREKSGAVAVEAAFIIPGLVALWLGMISILDLQSASTNVGKISSTVADILAQSGVINVPAIDCSFQAGDALLHADDAPHLEMYVVGIEVTDGESSVKWARGKNLNYKPLPVKDQPYTEMPDTLLDSDGFFVISHARLYHAPIFGSSFVSDGTVNFDYKNYFVPRISNTIQCSDCELLRDTPTQPC